LKETHKNLNVDLSLDKVWLKFIQFLAMFASRFREELESR